jgi:tetratricopeptide (TPR) repeat protein
MSRSIDVEQFRKKLVAMTALFKQGQFRECLAQCEVMAKQFPNEPNTANLLGATYAALGQMDQAIASYRKALQSWPDYAEAHSNLGDALLGLGKTEEAAASYQKAVHLKPELAFAQTNLGAALIQLGDAEAAVSSLIKALEIDPRLAEAHNNLGMAFNALGRPEEAISSLTTALQINPDFAEAHSSLGATLKSLGRTGEAIASYSRALKINPALARAHRFLSTVKTYQNGDPQLRQMRQLLQQENLSKDDRTDLNFALAKAHEDTGDYDRAFSYFAEGNRLRREKLNYDIASTRALFARIKETFANEIPILRDIEEPGPDSRERPVFVLGMPRSGTSLVEQILASHSQVHGAGELVLMGQAVNAVDWASRKLSADQLRFVRGTYLSGLEKLGRPEFHVVDKMPINFWWIGFIIAALPGASIIHVKRDARATCWSNYKQYFSERGNGYAYDLQDVTEYFKMYVDLMSYWHELFPDRIVDLDYESLTENQEEETRKLLGQIGLEWEDQCLDFHKTERAVQTASALQVRRAMYQDSSSDWQKYEKYLEPMVEALRGF